jgi:hypothetical protein
VTGGYLNIGNLFPTSTTATPGISAIQLTADGDVQLQLASTSSSQILETSIDLVTWQPLSGAKQVGANLQLTAENGAHRFYRLRSSPLINAP